MATMRFNMTYHAQVERIDRLTACIQHLGFNEIIKVQESNRHGRNVTRQLTDTGIILVVGEDGQLITGFMGTVAQVASMYGDARPPQHIINKAKKNVQKYKFLLKM